MIEKLSTFSSRLYHTTIKPIESYFVMNQKFNDQKVFVLWHERLGHLGFSMMRQIIKHSHGHPLKNLKSLLHNEYSCAACSQGKLIVILERIHGNISGPIHPPCGPIHNFMILIDASTRWSHVCLLFTRNVAFVRLHSQLIKL